MVATVNSVASGLRSGRPSTVVPHFKCPLQKSEMPTMSPILYAFAIAAILSLYASGSVADQEEQRHFSARQAFDYTSPILFKSDFANSEFDKLNLSRDSSYRQPKPVPGRLGIVAAPLLPDGTKAARFTVPRAANSYRSEISLPSENEFNERWYGISLFVPEEWVIDPNKGADIVIQWHAVPGNSKPTHPNVAIAIQESNWELRQSFGSPQKGVDRKKTVMADSLKPGAWVSWVVHAKWSPDETGRLRFWKDGEMVLDSTGPNVYGTIGKEYTPYLKTGIYHPEWNMKTEKHKERFLAETPGVEKKEIYISDVVVGSAIATFDLITSSLQGAAASKSE